MHRQNRLFWAFADFLLIIISYTVAFYVRTFAIWSEFRDSFVFILLAALLNVLALQLNGVYRRIWAQTSGYDVQVLLFSFSETSLILFLLDLIPNTRPLPLSVIFVGQFFGLAFSTALRYRSRLISGMQWRWNAMWWLDFPDELNVSRTLIVGAGKSGQLFAVHSRTGGSNDTQLRIMGFVDDDPVKKDMFLEGKPVMGQSQDIPWIVKNHHIDLIVIAIHNISSVELRRILDICHLTEAQVKMMPDVFSSITKNQRFVPLRDIRIEDIIGRASVPIDVEIDTTPITGKTILVTGAAGSIGSELSRQLLTRQPGHLLLLDNNESGLHDLFMELKSRYREEEIMTPLLCDVSDRFALENVFRTHPPQIVFHAAAYKHVPLLEDHPYEAIRINIGGTYNMVTLAQQYHVERFVLISSDKAVNSTSIMGATKYLCEQIVRSSATADILMTVVRFGNVLGSRGSVVPLFNRQIEEGGPVTVTDKRMTRFFMSIPEAAHLVIQAACLTHGQDVYILEMGESVPIVELAERMIRLRGLRPYRDIAIEFIGVRAGEELHERLLISGEARRATAHPYIFSIVPSPSEQSFSMDRLKHLLNGTMKAAPDQLKKDILVLARETQALDTLIDTPQNSADAPTA